MKICVINNLYPPYARGGAEQVVKKTIDGLLQANHEVVLITTRPIDKDIVEINEKLTIYRFKPKNLFFYTNAHKYNFFIRTLWHILDIFHLGSAKFVKQVLQKEKPDVVHTHNLMGIGFFIPKVIRKLNLRHLHTVHDVQLVEPSGIILKQKEHSWRYTGFPTKLYTACMRFLMGSPDVVISPSQFLLNFYEQRGFFKNSKRVVLRNPITFEPQKSGLKQQTNEFRFLYIGQIEEHKGIRFLIDTFLELEQESNSFIHLDVVGSGSLFSELLEKSKKMKNITMHGRVDRTKIPMFFKTADITVVPSLCYENSPTVIFESLALGVPVLASSIEGIAELIEEGKNGFTFFAGEQESLKKALLNCLKNKNNIFEMRKEVSDGIKELTLDRYMVTLLPLYT